MVTPRHAADVAIREHLIGRKSMGGIRTDVACRILGHNGAVIDGILAVGAGSGGVTGDDRTLALAGCPGVASLTPDFLAHP